jgi:hypothetical protein
MTEKTHNDRLDCPVGRVDPVWEYLDGYGIAT